MGVSIVYNDGLKDAEVVRLLDDDRYEVVVKGVWHDAAHRNPVKVVVERGDLIGDGPLAVDLAVQPLHKAAVVKRQRKLIAELVEKKELSAKHAEALYMLNGRVSHPLVSKFSNGNVWWFGRNQAYAELRKMGYSWSKKLARWIADERPAIGSRWESKVEITYGDVFGNLAKNPRQVFIQKGEVLTLKRYNPTDPDDRCYVFHTNGTDIALADYELKKQ